MAETKSTMLAPGTEAPAFDFPEPNGNRVTLDSFAGADGLVVAFICNHCPYAKRNAGRGGARRRSKAWHRLQHQVEAGQFPRLLRLNLRQRFAQQGNQLGVAFPLQRIQ